MALDPDPICIQLALTVFASDVFSLVGIYVDARLDPERFGHLTKGSPTGSAADPADDIPTTALQTSVLHSALIDAKHWLREDTPTGVGLLHFGKFMRRLLATRLNR
jgi:hypothetical protein